MNAFCSRESGPAADVFEYVRGGFSLAYGSTNGRRLVRKKEEERKKKINSFFSSVRSSVFLGRRGRAIVRPGLLLLLPLIRTPCHFL